MSRTAQCLLLALAIGMPGCSLPQFQEQVIALKNRSWAKIAWAQERGRYCNQPKPIRKTFGAGWREAYYDVAQGGSGTMPLFPPSDYWGVKYQNPLGRDQIDAWFAGYHYGAIAAKQDNVGVWMQIPTSGEPGKKEQLAVAAEPAAEQLPAPATDSLPPPQPPPAENLPPAQQTSFTTGSGMVRAAAEPIR